MDANTRNYLWKLDRHINKNKKAIATVNASMMNRRNRRKAIGYYW
jgi:hypothetical protein